MPPVAESVKTAGLKRPRELSRRLEWALLGHVVPAQDEAAPLAQRNEMVQNCSPGKLKNAILGLISPAAECIPGYLYTFIKSTRWRPAQVKVGKRIVEYVNAHITTPIW